jgi:predicted Zn-dependent protease
MVYGPRSAKEIRKAKEADSGGYFSLLAEALSLCWAPKFAGGNVKKGAMMLDKMAGQFPDSVDVRIHLAYAYWESGRGADARRLIAPIVKAYPANLLARKVAQDAAEK